MEDRPPLFQKYEMGRLLGKGTFAKAYYGKNLVSGESVAIKVIEKKNVMKDDMMNQIKREISVMRLVRHPNVVEIKEVLATKTKIFIIMEYVRGGELFEKVVRGKLEEDDSRRYFQQLISAVDFCHSRGISHRDLKPENLLLDDEGNLKVSDFGLSSLPEQLIKDGLLHTRCGTPAYVAPEVLLRGGYDGGKADIWSCGVILFVLHAGCLPFRDQNPMLMYRKIYKAEYKFPPWFSPEIKKLISKMLVPVPERRISIAAIMRLPWFTKGFTRPSVFKIDELPRDSIGEESRDFFTAFDIISPAFDLSNLFEKKRRAGLMFSSRCSTPAILENIEGIARGLEFKVAKVKGFKMMMQGGKEGRKGKLMVTAEVHEAAPEVAFVELCKSSGDTLEYAKFCEEELRPALRDIVWSWPGDNPCTCFQEVSHTAPSI